MTCKHLYENMACNRPEWVIEKDGKKYYPVCDYVGTDTCPYYEERNK